MTNRELIERLTAVHSALDDALVDTDVTHIEYDDELRHEHPTQWAAQHLAALMMDLASTHGEKVQED